MLKKNDLVTLKPYEIMQNGNAVAKTDDGFVVFVVAGVPGDILECRIIKVTKNYAVAKIEKVLKPSDDRIKDGCPFAQSCGGCAFQHISYKAESLYKKKSVDDAFEHIGGIDIRLSEYLPAKSTVFYRNKAIYPLSIDKNGKIISGFYARMSHRIIPHNECLIGSELFTKIKDSVVEFLQNKNISVYDEQKLCGLVRSIYLRKSYDNKVSLTLILNGKKLENDKTEKDFCAILLKKHPEISAISINENTGNSNSVLGKNWRHIHSDGYIYDVLCDKKFRITPASFWQINHESCEKLYNKAKEYADLKAGETLLDLYCGTGSVGICIAQKDTRLFGVEIVPEAVVDAKFNADLNGIDAHFKCLDTSKALDDEFLKDIKPDVITIDPPRKGCFESVEKISKLGADRIVYISCNPATLARDLKEFEKFGYKTLKACGVDMFPRTAHCEVVCALQRQTSQ